MGTQNTHTELLSFGWTHPSKLPLLALSPNVLKFEQIPSSPSHAHSRWLRLWPRWVRAWGRRPRSGLDLWGSTARTLTPNSRPHAQSDPRSTQRRHEYLHRPIAGAHACPRHAPDLRTSGRHCPHRLAACPRLCASANGRRSHLAERAKEPEIGRCRRATAQRRHGHLRSDPVRCSSPEHQYRPRSQLAWQSRPSADAAAAA